MSTNSLQSTPSYINRFPSTFNIVLQQQDSPHSYLASIRAQYNTMPTDHKMIQVGNCVLAEKRRNYILSSEVLKSSTVTACGIRSKTSGNSSSSHCFECKQFGEDLLLRIDEVFNGKTPYNSYDFVIVTSAGTIFRCDQLKIVNRTKHASRYELLQEESTHRRANPSFPVESIPATLPHSPEPLSYPQQELVHHHVNSPFSIENILATSRRSSEPPPHPQQELVHHYANPSFSVGNTQTTPLHSPHPPFHSQQGLVHHYANPTFSMENTQAPPLHPPRQPSRSQSISENQANLEMHGYLIEGDSTGKVTLFTDEIYSIFFNSPTVRNTISTVDLIDVPNQRSHQISFRKDENAVSFQLTQEAIGNNLLLKIGGTDWILLKRLEVKSNRSRLDFLLN